MTNLKLAWRNSHENYFSKHKNSLRFDCHEAQGSKWPGTRTEEKVLKPDRKRICAKDSVHAHIINREKLLDQRERCAIWRQNRVLNILDSELSLSPSRNSRKSILFCRKQVRSCVQQEKNVVRTRNLNQTCFSAKRIWYHPEKVRVPFFWNPNFWSIQLPKSYGYFFPPELKIQGNIETSACKVPKVQEKSHEFWQFLGSEEKNHP